MIRSLLGHSRHLALQRRARRAERRSLVERTADQLRAILPKRRRKGRVRLWL